MQVQEIPPIPAGPLLLLLLQREGGVESLVSPELTLVCTRQKVSRQRSSTSIALGSPPTTAQYNISNEPGFGFLELWVKGVSLLLESLNLKKPCNP